uniref:Endonuclease/exonuclease/phosphatase domain-containing protein n=1 Tax=Aplanochytrium stocchinoi TaxID=215587 RepID=A0A7S3LKF6_9STRA
MFANIKDNLCTLWWRLSLKCSSGEGQRQRRIPVLVESHESKLVTILILVSTLGLTCSLPVQSLILMLAAVGLGLRSCFSNSKLSVSTNTTTYKNLIRSRIVRPSYKYKYTATILSATTILFQPNLVRGVSTTNQCETETMTSVQKGISVINWNIAAINNNPFEYWITYENDEYAKLMDDVQEFIVNPGEKDVPIETVFTDTMLHELLDLMKQQGWDEVDISDTKEYWEKNFKGKTIIKGFMKDGELGKKRLASMPDRITNTINTVDGQVYRPTPINCYQGTFQSFEDWWSQWKDFMFEKIIKVNSKKGVATHNVASMILPIKRSKYPAVTEEEERISVPLSTLCAGIFDSILIHMLENVEGKQGWQSLRAEMCQALNMKKNERTVEILRTAYSDVDVMFLQEVANSFAKLIENDSALGEKFEVVVPNTSGKRDQNSIILLNRNVFDASSIEDVTDKIYANFKEGIPVAEGDVLAIKVKSKDMGKGSTYLLASFHGDTNGLATIPVLEVLHTFIQENLKDETVKFVFGLDANTYENAKKGKTQCVKEFAEYYVSLGMNSCHGTTPDPSNYTTYNARTFLQTQLNKACTREEFLTKGDVNPKDFVLFYDKEFSSSNTFKDNTGERKYIERMVFPTLSFPSDHAVLYTELTAKSCL